MTLDTVPQATVLIRPDVGPSAGLGHLGRCLALAQGIGHFAGRSVFAVHGDATATARIEHSHCEQISLSGFGGSDEEVGELTNTCARLGAPAIVVDSYRFGAAQLSALRSRGLMVAALDDLAAFSSPAHVVINGSANADSMPHRSSTGDTEFLLGADYAMLPVEYWRPTPRRLCRQVRRVLVSLGGATTSFAGCVAEALAALREDVEVDWVLGPYDESACGTTQWTELLGRRLSLVRNPDSLRSLLLETDLLVCGGGQTTYQAAVTGTPALALTLAPNQAANVQGLSRARVVTTADLTGAGSDLMALRSALQELLSPTGLREQLSENGQRLVDGQGAIRVARRVLFRAEKVLHG